MSWLFTNPAHSLIHQSFHSREREEPLNGDGFGLAWYAPDLSEEPAVFRATTPAWSNRNLLDLARVVRSPCILAHVRAATRSTAVSEANCHPFRWGRFTFMHNGDVGGFRRVRRELLAILSDDAFRMIEGTTDSEHVFALFTDRVHRRAGEDPAEAMTAAMRETLELIVGLVERHGDGLPSYLNMAVSDGRCAVVTRFTTDAPEHSETLYMDRGRRYVCFDGVCCMLPAGEADRAVLISSEPLTEDAGWEVIPPNHVVTVRQDRTTAVVPC